MSFLSAIWSRFTFQSKSAKSRVPDIKFSSLIESIQQDLLSANESLEGVGFKYIEKFFDKPLAPSLALDITEQLDDINDLISMDDKPACIEKITALKQRVHMNEQSNEQPYRPKMTSFEIPTLIDGKWVSTKVSVPLIALAPLPMPKITGCTLSSPITNITKKGDDIYLNISPTTTGKTAENEQSQLTISITPEYQTTQLNELITQYKNQFYARIKNNSAE
ncbi:hypothetical protein LP316_13070 [Thalassotalea sp. LPB0316]|uniref:hypothetical protein n=1 Tax=Thalassotalea sp. LPB0316 TaxID=2769490 RepID=UPI0018671C80|nr:hypothetical protein [Thalassotalea sp. LPB0316]QOL25216.1 hypothetical protein LP316_13070 [Thalassotalea sp. LPB0316]